MQTAEDWIRAEHKRLSPTHPAGGTKDRELAKHWMTHRPKMAKRLQAQGLLIPLANVLTWRMVEATEEYRRAGMSPSEAKLTATAEILMLEPETEPTQTIDPLRDLLDPTMS